MSLIHHWPLVDGLKDIISRVPLTGDSTETIGKIGPCRELNEQFLRVTNSSLKDLSVFSVSMWFKYSSAKAAWTDIFGLEIQNNVSPKAVSLRLEITSIDGTSAGIFNNGILTNSSGAGKYLTLTKEKWHHFVLTKDNELIQYFLDGVLIQQYRFLDVIDCSDGWCTGEFHLGDETYNYKGCFNDVRIYNHVLNDLEIKELAKALVLQYNFNNIYAESTVNLISGLRQGGRTTYDSENITITTAGLNQDTYFYLKTSEALVEGTTYTLTCWGENIGEGKEFTFGMQGQTTEYQRFTIKDGYNELTFVANSYVNGLTEILMDDTSRTGWESKAIFSKFQLEKRDYATPYVRGTRNGLGIEDESGYGRSTTIYNNSALTKDTNSGSFGFRTSGSEDRTAHANCSYLKADLGASITPTAFTIAFNAKVNTWGAQTSGVLSLNTVGTEPTAYLGSTFVQYDSNFRLNNSVDSTQKSISAGIIIKNEWHHYAFTWDGKVLKGYRDGSQYGSDVAAEFVPDPFRYVFLGYDRAGGAGRDADITWGDFRLYMTTLRAEEILDLAKTKGYITENGDIACGEFVEDQAEALITGRSVFETAEVCESALPDEYDQLESISFDYAAGTSEPYINTGYNTTDIYQIDCDIEVAAAASNYQFGQQQKSGWMYNGFYGTGSLEFNWAALTPRPTARARHTMTQTLSEDGSELIIIIDGTTWTTTPGTNGQGGDFYIFACRNNNNAFRHYGAGMTLYSFRIHEGYRTIRDFIPARRRNDGAIGLYDVATQMLYTNAGTGEFKAGPIVKNNEAMIYENGNISGKEIIEI